MKQKTGKRSAALPITLILLVFSLIGNVFLYSQQLQRQQNDKYEAGRRIHESAQMSEQYFRELIEQIDALLQSKEMKDRQASLVVAGKASQKGEALLKLAAEANRLAPGETAIDEAAFLAFTGRVDAILLQPIGGYEGPLNEKDRQQLLVLKDYMLKMADTLGGLNANIADNRTALIRLSGGAGWLERVGQIGELMSEYAAT